MKTRLLTLIAFYFSILLINSSNLTAQCNRSADSLALVALYNSTNGANWTNTWDLNMPMDIWHGVTLNIDGCIDALNLDTPQFEGNNLGGSIPDDFWNLSNIKSINLANNQTLSGTLSSSIGNVQSLEKLFIWNTSLEGNLPVELGNLTNLLLIRLSDNQLEGTIPTSLNNLTNLTSLILSQNQFNQIPDLSNLDNLTSLHLSSNPFNTNIPLWISNLDKLQTLDLKDNQWHGNIPSSFANLTNLDWVSFGGNNLSGELPNWLGQLTNLNVFEIWENNYAGLIPNIGQSNPNLSWFQGIGNKFTFEDIIPHFASNSSEIDIFIYGSQQKVFKDTTIIKTIGENVVIDLLIDDTVTTNIYKWFKDGQLVTTIQGNNQLVFNNIQSSDFGVYICQVTNPNVPDLTLESHTIALASNDICEGATSIECGDVITGSTADAIYDTALDNCFNPHYPNLNKNGLWYKITGNDKVIKINSCNSTIESLIAVFEGTCDNLSCEETRGFCTGNFSEKRAEVNFWGESGQTYYVLVYGLQQGNFELAVSCYDRPDNDLCINAQTITCGETVVDSTYYATIDTTDICPNYNFNHPGLWYKIIGTGQTIEIDACSKGSKTGITVYEGDCGNLTCLDDAYRNCQNGANINFASQLGTTYYINVSTIGGYDNIEFTVNCGAPPVNDLCSNAISINCGETVTGMSNFATKDAVLTNCTNSFFQGDDEKGIWYSIQGNDKVINLSTCNSAVPSYVAVLEGNCNNLNCIAKDGYCLYQYSDFSFFGETGKTYYLAVYGGGVTGTFELTVDCQNRIPNDLCENAPMLNCGSTIVSSTKYATKDAVDNCTSGVRRDNNGLWYQLVGTGDLININATQASSQASITLFEGSCNNLTCINLGNFGPSPSMTFQSEVGKQYFFNVSGYIEYIDFELVISCGQAPTNENCDNPISIECDTNYSISHQFATLASIPNDCNPYNSSGDLWYEIIGSDQQVTLTVNAQGISMHLLTGDCNNLNCVSSSYDWKTNSNPNQDEGLTLLSFYAEMGVAYKIQIFNFNKNTQTLEVKCEEPLVNDQISGAIPIYCDQIIIGDNYTASNDNDVVVCQGASGSYNQPHKGIWYKFTGTGERVNIHTCSSTSQYEIAAYSGSPQNLTCLAVGHTFSSATSLICKNRNNPFVNFLTQEGATYYILVRTYAGPVGTFELHYTSENCTCEGYPDMVNLMTTPAIPDTMQTHGDIQSTEVLTDTSNYTLMAGGTVTLLPGFSAPSGSNFVVKISNCPTNLVANIPSTSRTSVLAQPIPTDLLIYPNPFQNQTNIEYVLRKDQQISLGVYAITGKLIQQLEQHTLQTKGKHNYQFRSNQLEPGMYLVILQTETEQTNKKIILVD